MIEVKLKNYYLDSIKKGLAYPNASFQIGRAKMRVVKFLDEKSKIVSDSRAEMLTTLSEKDENGKAKFKDGFNAQGIPQKQYDLTPENLAKFNQEFDKMMQEDIVIEFPDSMKNDIGTFRNLLNNSQAKDLSDGDVVILDEVLEAFKAADAPAAPKEEEKTAAKPAKKA